MKTVNILFEAAKKWAKTQKRVTNKSLRDRFDIDEDAADEVYKMLKEEGIIGYGGYVEVST